MKVYLSGKMRGVRCFNKPAFVRYTGLLRAAGYEVFSPVENTERIYGPYVYDQNETGDEATSGIDGRVVFAADLKWICEEAEAIAMMPGWENSSGASAERACGLALGLVVRNVEEFLV